VTAWAPRSWHQTTYHRVALGSPQRRREYVARCDCGWHSPRSFWHGVDAHRAAARHLQQECPYPRRA
jgi:hypothetical protein